MDNLPAPGPRVAAEYRISEGTEGVRETLAIMRSIARRYRSDPSIVEYARRLVMGVPQKDWLGQVRKIFYFVRDRIRYVQDPNEVETLSTPEYLLANMSAGGDCDDKSVLLATLLEASGHPARFRAVGFEGGALTHVYVETKLGERWIPLDTTESLDAGELMFDPREVKNSSTVHV